MLHRDEQANLLRIARQLEGDDRTSPPASARAGPRKPVRAAATIAVGAGALCFFRSLSLASTPLLVLGLIMPVAGLTTLTLRFAR